jgi:hypothetical protein
MAFFLYLSRTIALMTKERDLILYCFDTKIMKLHP